MDSTQSHIDMVRSHLRVLVGQVEREVSSLPAQVDSSDGKNATNDLRASWAELVKVLALGPEPQWRACPTCSKLGIRDASICGYCWTKLTPLPKDAAGVT